jgi:hypothetical protein
MVAEIRAVYDVEQLPCIPVHDDLEGDSATETSVYEQSDRATYSPIKRAVRKTLNLCKRPRVCKNTRRHSESNDDGAAGLGGLTPTRFATQWPQERG